MAPQHSAASSDDRWRLSATQLTLQLAPAELGFRTTAELEPLEQVVGQERALRALEFGLAVRHRGYNIFVSGMTGTGRKQLVQRLLQARARQESPPNDWVYVHNFQDPYCPLALCLPSGQGVKLRAALQEILDRLKQDLPVALKAKDFDAEREHLSSAYGKRSEELFQGLVEQARKLDMAIRRLPNGVLLFIPLVNNRPMEQQELDQLSEVQRAEIERRQQELGEFAAGLLAQQQELMRSLRRDIEEIVRTFARRILDPLFERTKKDLPGVELAAWLDSAHDHLLGHLDRLQEEKPESGELPAVLRAAERDDPWLEYRVNVVADNSRAQGAPVIIEISPTYKNLFGTIEHDVNLFGRVTTNFTRIKPGSLLQASGGYLIFDLEDALTEPLVWKQLKRTLKSGQLLTDVYEPLSLFTSTTALKPQPIPLATKVVVLGSPQLFYFLQFVDQDFQELFKICADFGPETPRDSASHQSYARFIARQVQVERLPHFDAEAVVEIIRLGTRQAGHQGKLSVELGLISDVIREAGHWARMTGAELVQAAHVRQALAERVYRSDRLATKIRELIQEGTLRLTLTGSRVGQINGLALLDLGDYRFGRPSRVTAAAGIGQEGVISIERESDLSGSTHDKGMLILQGYMRQRYARNHPLALSASIAFEQSYGWIEGDSASSVELYCLLSALAEVPLRQDIAVTGSVNQHGDIQAVGGVNEKVEGFFDICSLTGLTGTQGVCLPRDNVRHLILRPDVVQAVQEGRFHLWAIDNIDEGLELLTGMPAGDLEVEGTFHYLLDQRLQNMLDLLQEKPPPVAALHVRSGPQPPPPPAPPPLPGEKG